MLNKYKVVIEYDEKDQIFVASIPELPGCMAHGKTQEEALAEIQIAKDLWMEAAEQVGKTIPFAS